MALPERSSQVPAVTQAPSVPPEVAREAQIARLLTECDVFSRYGLHSKVIEQLNRILEIAPEQVEARERLKDVYLAQGMTQEGLAQLYRLAENFSNEKPQVANLYYRQILEIDPQSEPAQSRVTYSHPPPRRSSAPPVPTLLEVDENETTDDILFIEEGPDAVSYPSSGPATSPPGPPDIALPRSGIPGLKSPPTLSDGPMGLPTELGSTDPELEGFADKTELTPLERLSAVPLPGQDSSDSTFVGGGYSSPTSRPPASAESLDSLNPISPAEFEAGPVATDGASVDAALKRASLPPSEVEEILDEADFFIAQGLFGEAASTLRDALSAHPNHAVIVDKLAEVESSIANASSPNEGADASFLLAEKLAEELEEETDTADVGSDVLDVESVFAQFKKGVQEQIGADDTDTHFDLGIAYKEMGLLDDAIQEFELARQSSQKECIAFTMIGLCCVEKGQIADAIAQFKKGLYAENKTDREELGLYFELGIAYELLHDPAEALYYFQKVQKRSPSFRKVSQRIQALESGSKKPASGPDVSVDDVDRAFDDLMGED